MKKRLGKNDWFTAGFSVLEEDGFAQLTIENLCKRLGVTKGSFYHHFQNLNAYIQALMDYWLEENTLNVIRQVDQVESKKSSELNRLTSYLRHNSELQIRAWSFTDPLVMEYVRKVDQIRLDYLAGLLTSTGLEGPIAQERALLEYAMLIGMQHLASDLPASEWDRLQQTYLEKKE